MIVLKVLFLVAAAVLSLVAIRFMMRETQAVKVKARAPHRPQHARHLRRLRQDPRTGVYYPEE